MDGAAPLGEFELIARYFAPMAAQDALGLLDDAAVMTPPAGCDLVLTKDALIAGIHFFADDPSDTIARKALRVNLSDLAAKGATPLGFLLGLGLPAGWSESWLASFARGLADDSAAFDCPLYGGDTVKSPERLTLSVTAIGAVPHGRMIRRSGGKPGDILYVTGTIGDGALGLIERDRQRAGGACELALVQRYLLPEPRNQLTAALLNHANAAMDISDGLVGDAAKLAAASRCGLIINADRVPLSPAARRIIAGDPARFATALTGGDDYEILCAVPASSAHAFEEMAAAASIAVTAIGHLQAGQAVSIVDGEGQPIAYGAGSFRHF